MSLYVCGDSFASLVLEQPNDLNWSEIVAKKLNTNLQNIARPAASNIIISMQLNYIIEKLSFEDYVVLFLTDHFRLIDIKGTIDPNYHIFEQIVDHKNQKIKSLNKNQVITPGTLMNPVNDLMTKTFNQSFDPLLQYYIDKEVMLGTLSKLKQKTKNFLVISGGWGRSLSICADISKDLQILDENLLDFNVQFLNGLNEKDSVYMNHLTDLGHAKLASFVYQRLKIY